RIIIIRVGISLGLSRRQTLLQRTAQQKLVPEWSILRRIQIDSGEDIGANHVRREALFVLGIVKAASQRQPVGNFKIDRSENRIGFVAEIIGFVKTVAGAEKAADILGRITVQRAKSLLQYRNAQCSARSRLNQCIAI